MLYTILLNTNILTLVYLFFTAFIFVVGWLINFLSHSSFLPAVFSDFFKYGKLNHEKKLNIFVSWLQVPKRWFQHFYILAFVEALIALYMFWRISIMGLEFPQWIQHILDFLTVPNRVTTIHSGTASIVLCLYSAHITKRLYETVCLSIFSSSSMNLSHYIVGHYHYAASLTLLLSLFPGFAVLNSNIESDLVAPNLLGIILQVCGVTIVALSSYMQYESLKRLAFLRLSNKESLEKYLLPYGGLFELLSCPHMFCESLVYVGLATIMGFRHTSFNIVCLFVICNQIQVAIMNHHWYKSTFKDYPRNRKAILPYLL